jgi:small subunit ribosomal protein S18
MVQRNSRPHNKNNNNSNKPLQNTEEGYVKVSLVNQSVFIRRKRACPLRDIAVEEINYKNLTLLNKFLSERGRIIPARITNVEIKKQRALANAIKRARQLALISPIKKDVVVNS